MNPAAALRKNRSTSGEGHGTIACGTEKSKQQELPLNRDRAAALRVTRGA